MKVILMTDVPALGRRGDTKEVASGYARNYLLPRKLAVPATPANVRNLESLQRQRAREEHRATEEARVHATRIEGLTLRVIARASEDGRLYGSVSAQDVVEFLEREQVPVDSYGVGSSLFAGRFDFTADIVEVEGRALAKQGRSYRANPRLEIVD